MSTRLITLLRNRFHVLWRLRRLPAFRRFQNRFDCTVYTRIPETDLKVAVKLLRDASWIADPANMDQDLHRAFALVLDVLKPATFWDVGANIGFYSWFVRRYPSIRKVIMFEPDPTNFALITRTIRKNGVSDCQPMNIALADRSGEASFLLDRASGATGALESASHRENKQSLHHAYALGETITCRTATIDGLIAEGVPPPDLIKIDVEGAEHLVLAGAEVFLANHSPAMIIETSNPDLVRRLKDTGYAVFRIDWGNLLFTPNKAGMDLLPFSQTLSPYD